MRLLPAFMILGPLAGCGRTDGIPLTAAPTDSLAAISQRFFATNRLPGLAVGVWQKGRVVYRAGFGTTALQGGRPVTPATVFHMASVTKPFVATAVVQLVEQGAVSLDQPVTAYLPYFRIQGPRAAGMTVRQVLTHTAGLPDVTDYHWGSPESDDGALERWVKALADSTLIAPPSERWQYSNIGFEVLADLIAKTSGVPFEDYVQRRILTPLGMRKSTLLMTDVDSTLLAFGHEGDSTGAYRQSPRYPYNRRHAASSTLHSNVDDMLRWAAANLAGGTLEGARIVADSSYRELWGRQHDMTAALAARAKQAGAPMPYDSVAIGLSWFLPWQGGRRVVFHSGGDEGFRTFLVLAPDREAAVVVMTNGDRADVGELANALLAATAP
jgi:CubicO group peptidase (beta-lactamase class C family)